MKHVKTKHTSNQVTPHIVLLPLKKSTDATSISFTNLCSIMIPKEILFTRQVTKPATVTSFSLFCRLLCSCLFVLYDCSKLLLEFSLFLCTISASEYLSITYSKLNYQTSNLSTSKSLCISHFITIQQCYILPPPSLKNLGDQLIFRLKTAITGMSLFFPRSKKKSCKQTHDRCTFKSIIYRTLEDLVKIITTGFKNYKPVCTKIYAVAPLRT